MIQKIILIFKELISNKFISLIVFFAITISIFCSALFNIMGSNFNDYVHEKFTTVIPPNTLKVSPKEGDSLLFFKLNTPKKNQLNYRALNRIKKISGVTTIDPILTVNIPLQGRVGIFGHSYVSDMLAFGVSYDFIKRDIKSRKYKRLWKNPDFKNKVPVLIPNTILNAFNNGMAEANGLPKISPDSVIGLGFKIYFGHSSIKTLDEFTTVDGMLVGFTGRINSLALIVPLKVARYYNKKYTSYGGTYLYAFIKVKDHKSLLSVSAKIKKMGFNVEAEKSLSKHILSLKRNVNLVIDSLMYLIMILSIITILFSTAIASFSRIEYYNIMRVLGASRIFLGFTVAVKYILIGFAGTYLGLELIDILAENLKDIIKLPVVMLSFSLPEALYYKILFFGAIIPAISIIPVFISIYFKRLNKD